MSTSSVDFQFKFCHVLTVKSQFMIITLLNAIYKTKSVKIKFNSELSNLKKIMCQARAGLPLCHIS